MFPRNIFRHNILPHGIQKLLPGHGMFTRCPICHPPRANPLELAQMQQQVLATQLDAASLERRAHLVKETYRRGIAGQAPKVHLP